MVNIATWKSGIGSPIAMPLCPVAIRMQVARAALISALSVSRCSLPLLHTLPCREGRNQGRELSTVPKKTNCRLNCRKPGCLNYFLASRKVRLLVYEFVYVPRMVRLIPSFTLPLFPSFTRSLFSPIPLSLYPTYWFQGWHLGGSRMSTLQLSPVATPRKEKEVYQGILETKGSAEYCPLLSSRNRSGLQGEGNGSKGLPRDW